ncbi:MAG: tyrosine-type recombinase/integrase [Dialister sp.]|uniref:tyrosine-type recombinase/integrase n=1 Tax=Dialister sp. TaxID=1955814 RepID=UPI001D296789|nr:tyrosine-type recombinase/integrase [Dialister sp.]MBS6715306.1 tyrosine-type recombinase/integrase [Dialister sp.]
MESTALKRNGYISIYKDGDKTQQAKSHVKKERRKSEVYPFQLEDARKMVDYFKDRSMWLHYMLFTMSCNMARRVGDMLTLKWYHIYSLETGRFRTELLEIVEDKTDKLANPRINSACRNAIETYLKETGCDPAENNFQNPVFLQLTGTHKGTVISPDGYRKALKKAAKAVGIEYNVGTHSARKTFGMMNRMLHPNDYDSMEILQTIYNHSDVKTTKHYIGLTKQKVDQYYDDMGNFFGEYIEQDKKFIEDKAPVVTMKATDLRDLLKISYEKGRENTSEQDLDLHLDALNELNALAETLFL